MKSKPDALFDKVIKNDIKRTRCNDRLQHGSYEELLYNFLHKYCSIVNINYKQGLNELFGIFLLLHFKISLKPERIFSFSYFFIDRYFLSFYIDDKFVKLKAAQKMIRCLLSYQDAELHRMLDINLISTDIYSTSWLLTGFVSKVAGDLALYWMDRYIMKDRPYFIIFIIVALLIKNREDILETEVIVIPTKITSFQLNSKEEIDDVFSLASTLEKETPASFLFLIKELCIFSTKTSKIKLNEEICFPMYPGELLFLTYPRQVFCPNIKCERFVNKTGKMCYYCPVTSKRSLETNIFDIRLAELEQDKDESGSIPTSVVFEPTTVIAEDFVTIMTKKFRDMKKACVVLVTSETESFIEFEDNYFKEIEVENNFRDLAVKPKRMLDEKVFDIHELGRETTFKLKEYELVKQFCEEFGELKVSRVCYLLGGYSVFHDLAVKNELNLTNHTPKCFICQGNGKFFKRRSLFEQIFSTSSLKMEDLVFDVQDSSRSDEVERVSIGEFRDSLLDVQT